MRRKQDTAKWEEIGAELTDTAFQRLGITDILRFNKDGRITEWKVMRMNKKKRKCYVQQVRTYTPAEFEALTETKV
jgi:hypothetical protein